MYTLLRQNLAANAPLARLAGPRPHVLASSVELARSIIDGPIPALCLGLALAAARCGGGHAAQSLDERIPGCCIPRVAQLFVDAGSRSFPSDPATNAPLGGGASVRGDGVQ